MINKPTSPSTPSARPRGRPRAFDRETVLRCAEETFYRLGYEGASIAELTAAMKITPQSLYAAFCSKADLYKEVLDYFQRTRSTFVACALNEEGNCVNALQRVLTESASEFSKPRRPRGCMISTGALGCGIENQSIATYVSGLRREALAALEARIRKGIEDGDLHTDTDAAALARFVNAVIQGMAIQARDGASKAELAGVAATACATVIHHGW